MSDQLPSSVINAINAINNINSVAEFRTIVSNLGVDLPNAKTYVFYSGSGQYLNIDAEDAAVALAKHSPNGEIGIINNTDRGTFLGLFADEDSIYRTQLKVKLNFTDADINKLFYDASENTGLWAQASSDYIKNINGTDVRVVTLTANANPGRVWSDVEVEELLRSDKVTHINGVLKTEIFEKANISVDNGVPRINDENRHLARLAIDELSLKKLQAATVGVAAADRITVAKEIIDGQPAILYSTTFLDENKIINVSDFDTGHFTGLDPNNYVDGSKKLLDGDSLAKVRSVLKDPGLLAVLPVAAISVGIIFLGLQAQIARARGVLPEEVPNQDVFDVMFGDVPSNERTILEENVQTAIEGSLSLKLLQLARYATGGLASGLLLAADVIESYPLVKLAYEVSGELVNPILKSDLQKIYGNETPVLPLSLFGEVVRVAAFGRDGYRRVTFILKDGTRVIADETLENGKVVKRVINDTSTKKVVTEYLNADGSSTINTYGSNGSVAYVGILDFNFSLTAYLLQQGNGNLLLGYNNPLQGEGANSQINLPSDVNDFHEIHSLSFNPDTGILEITGVDTAGNDTIGNFFGFGPDLENVNFDNINYEKVTLIKDGETVLGRLISTGNLEANGTLPADSTYNLEIFDAGTGTFTGTTIDFNSSVQYISNAEGGAASGFLHQSVDGTYNFETYDFDLDNQTVTNDLWVYLPPELSAGGLGYNTIENYQVENNAYTFSGRNDQGQQVLTSFQGVSDAALNPNASFEGVTVQKSIVLDNSVVSTETTLTADGSVNSEIDPFAGIQLVEGTIDAQASTLNVLDQNYIRESEARSISTGWEDWERTNIFNEALADPNTLSDPNWNPFLEEGEINYIGDDDSVITAGNIGAALGSSLGNVIAGDNVFAQVAASSVLGTLTRNIFETAAFLEAGWQLGEAADAAFNNFSTDLAASFRGAAVGAVSSYLVGELTDALGIGDEFGGQLFEHAASTVTRAVLNNAIDGVDDLFAGLEWGFKSGQGLAAGLGAFLGGYLANEVYQPETQAGAIAGSIAGSLISTAIGVGSTGGALSAVVGGAAGAAAGILAPIATVFLPLAFVFAATIIFTKVFDVLFGEDPRAQATLDFNFATNEFELGYSKRSDDGNIEFAREMVKYSSNILNGYIGAVGGELVHDEAIRSLRLGHYEDSIRIMFSGNYQAEHIPFDTVEEMLDYAVLDQLRQLKFAGGDVYLKRAIANSQATTIQELSGDFQIAVDYKNYLANREVINAIIALQPNSAFAAAWIVTLLRAEELGLTRMSEADFDGGLQGFLSGLGLEIYGATLADVSVTMEDTTLIVEIAPENAELQRIEIQNFSAMTGLQHLVPTGGNTTGTDGDDLWFADDGVDSTFTDQGRNIAGTSNDVLIGGTGNDTINGGIGLDMIQGGEGNDTLDGGEGSDTVLGNAGDDIVRGGDGNDTLSGGTGTDTLEGGYGDDLYIFQVGDGSDTIIENGTSYSPVTVSKTIDIPEVVEKTATIRQIGKRWVDGGEFSDGYYEDINEETTETYYETEFNTETRDVIADHSGGYDVLRFGTGITPDSIILRFDGDDLVVALKDPDNPDETFENLSDCLRLTKWRDTLDRIEAFVFADGQLLNVSAIMTLLDTTVHSFVELSDAADVASGGSGQDIILGGDGDDTISGGSEQDILRGQEGNDTLNGEAGEDILIGGIGDDTITGGTGADWIDGGAGIDTAIYSASNAGVNIDLTKTISFGGHADGDRLVSIENITGSNHDDEIIGSFANNELRGLSGNDTLEGNLGNDILEGGAGADTLIGGLGLDTADYSNSNSAVFINMSFDEMNDMATRDKHEYLGNITSDDFVIADGGHATGDTLAEIENIIGSSYADTLIGDDFENKIEGHAGADHIFGAGGYDIASYASSSSAVTINLDTKSASGGHASGDTLVSIEGVEGSDLSDTLTGNDDDNILLGLSGNDVIIGGLGHDTLIGGEGSDTLQGGHEDDILHGGEADDTLEGGLGNDLYIFNLGDGSDTIIDNGISHSNTTVNKSIDNVTLASRNKTVSVTNAYVGQWVPASEFSDGHYSLINNHQEGGVEYIPWDSSYEGNSQYAPIDRVETETIKELYYKSDIDSSTETIDQSGGIDTLRFGEGISQSDLVLQLDNNDLVVAIRDQDNPDASFESLSDKVRLTNWTDSLDRVEIFEFTDGRQLTLPEIVSLLDSTSALNLIEGTSEGDLLQGNASDNIMIGKSGDDIFAGSAGSDWIEGDSGKDTVDYSQSQSAIAVNLDFGNENTIPEYEEGQENSVAAIYGLNASESTENLHLGVGQGGEADGDTIINVENIIGSNHNDILVGNSRDNELTGNLGNDTLIGGLGNDKLQGGAGGDTIDGGSGADIASYENSDASVTVNLDSNTVSGGHAQGDTLTSIEDLIGSSFNDTLIGDDGSNIIEGGAGADTLDGKEGLDTLSYENSNVGVTVNLEANTSSGGHASGDIIQNFESLIGSQYNDVLTGTSDVNILQGMAGDDSINATFGNDRIDGGEGNDTISYQALSSSIISDLSNGRSIKLSQGIENILISGLPSDINLQNGTNNGDGTWSLTLEEFLNAGFLSDNTENQSFTYDVAFDALAENGSSTKYSLQMLGILNEGQSSNHLMTYKVTEDYENGAVGWNNNTVTDGGSAFTKFLGRFGKANATPTEGQHIWKEFEVPEGIETVTFEFDFYELDSWDNEDFAVYVNGDKFAEENFHNGSNDDNHNDSTPLMNRQNIGFSGWSDQKHRFTFEAPVVDGKVTLGFSSNLNGSISDESWGIDNLSLSFEVNPNEIVGSDTIAKVISEEDFEGVVTGWHLDDVTSSVAEFTSFLGRYGGTSGYQAVYKEYEVPTGTNEVLVEFDFYEIDSWDNEDFIIFVNDQEIARETFHVHSDDNDHTYSTMVTNRSNRGFSNWSEQTHRFSINVPVTGDIIKLGFGSTLNEGATNESWGIDNLKITSISPADDLLNSLDNPLNILSTIVPSSDDKLENIENIIGTDNNDVLIGDSGVNILSGGAGDDTLTGSQGNDILTGGTGSDTYYYNYGDGTDVINNQDSSTDTTDSLNFGNLLDAENLWFTQQDDNLVVSVLGTSDQIMFEDWYSNEASKIDQFVTNDDRILYRSEVDQLVSAMASFNNTDGSAPSDILSATLPDDVQIAINSSW